MPVGCIQKRYLVIVLGARQHVGQALASCSRFARGPLGSCHIYCSAAVHRPFTTLKGLKSGLLGLRSGNAKKKTQFWASV